MWRKSDSPASPSSEEAVPAYRAEANNREPAPASRLAQSTHLGKTIAIKGEITGREDLYLDGELDGTIRLADARLTVGPSGHLRAEAEAREIEVQGEAEGTLLGRERVRIGRTGKVTGDIMTRRIAVEEGAVIHGSVDIARPGEANTRKPAAATASAAAGSPGMTNEGAVASGSREPVNWVVKGTWFRDFLAP